MRSDHVLALSLMLESPPPRPMAKVLQGFAPLSDPLCSHQASRALPFCPVILEGVPEFRIQIRTTCASAVRPVCHSQDHPWVLVGCIKGGDPIHARCVPPTGDTLPMATSLRLPVLPPPPHPRPRHKRMVSPSCSVPLSDDDLMHKSAVIIFKSWISVSFSSLAE